MYYPLQLRFDTAAGTDDVSLFALHERVEVQGAYIVVNANVTGNASDYVTLAILGNDQSTAMYQWSTDTGAEGTLTADTPVEMVSQGKENLAIFDAGDAIKVTLTNTGSTGIAFDGMLVLNCRQARKY